MKKMSYIAALMVINTSGCAIVKSERITSDFNTYTGLRYMLPKAMIPLQVVDNKGVIRVDVLQPVIMGDPNYSYAIQYVNNPFSSDTIGVEVDPKTSLLKTITLESKDETGDVLKKIVGLTYKPEMADAGNETILLDTWLDPDDSVSVTATSNTIGAVVKKHLEARKIECKDAAKKTTDECISYNSIPTDFDTVIAINAKEAAPNKKNAGSTEMCSVGICYRGSSPYSINLKFMGQDRTVMVQLPNNSPIMAMPLKGHLFVTTKHTVVLQDGMLQKHDRNKPSSALAMVSWPLSVADEVITTTSKIVQMKIDTSKRSVELEQQLLAAQQERKKIQDDLDKLNQPKAEGYGLVVNSSKSLLTAQVGKPKPIISSSPQVPQSNPQIQQPVDNRVSPSNDGTLVKKP